MTALERDKHRLELDLDTATEKGGRLEKDLAHANDKLEETAKLLESNQQTITW